MMKIHSFSMLVYVDWYILNENVVFVVCFNYCIIGIFYYATCFKDSCCCTNPEHFACVLIIILSWKSLRWNANYWSWHSFCENSYECGLIKRICIPPLHRQNCLYFPTFTSMYFWDLQLLSVAGHSMMSIHDFNLIRTGNYRIFVLSYS